MDCSGKSCVSDFTVDNNSMKSPQVNEQATVGDSFVKKGYLRQMLIYLLYGQLYHLAGRKHNPFLYLGFYKSGMTIWLMLSF
jgi:hypothetical protein